MPPEKRRSGVVWPIAAAVLLVLILVAGSRAGSSAYRRFVSQPLPDGSRYTFLYPAHLQNVEENGKGASPGVTHTVNVHTRNQNEPVWVPLQRRLGFSSPSPAEFVTVLVMPVKAAAKVQDSRRQEEWVRGGERRRNEYLTDARTRTKLFLFYSCPKEAPTSFEAHKSVIGQTLRLLPPGAAPPRP